MSFNLNPYITESYFFSLSLSISEKDKIENNVTK